MKRAILAAAAIAGLLAGPALAQQPQQQRMPSNPPAQGPSASQPSGASSGSSMDRPTGTTSRTRDTTSSRGQGRQPSKMDSIASGLNECQLRPQDQRQPCIDQVIRENGG